MRRVGVYIDYSNVYKGARSAFLLDGKPGHRGNVHPVRLAQRLASISPSGADRRATHALAFTKVFRGAPDPVREKYAALMEAKRAHQWEQWGALLFRQTLDYGRGHPQEKGVDVRLTSEMLLDAVRGEVDVAVLVSADKDFRYALINARDASPAEVEVAIWKALPGESRPRQDHAATGAAARAGGAVPSAGQARLRTAGGHGGLPDASAATRVGLTRATCWAGAART